MENEEQIVSMSELEITVSHIMPGSENIVAFHVRACSPTTAQTLLLLHEAMEKHDMLMRTHNTNTR
jgi:hypothetical protein